MKTWKVDIEKKALKELNSLGPIPKKNIAALLDRLETMPEPHKLAESLQGRLKGFFRYRVGDYRLVCKIKEQILTIIVVEIAHRREVYKRKFH
jgi:mRNA interferase RelE/StbE